MSDSTDSASPPEFERAEVAKLNEMRLKRASPKPDGRNAYEQLKNHVTERLLAFINSEQEDFDETNLRPMLLDKFSEMLVEERIVLNRSERRELIEDVLSEVMGPDSQIHFDQSS